MSDSIYSPWSFPRDPAEERKKEHERWRSLTPEQRAEEWEMFSAKVRKASEERAAKKMQKQKERSEKSNEYLYVHAENPHSLDDGEATVSWLIVMIVGAIFKERWLIWIVATALYWCKMNRPAIRKWKWDNGGKEEYYKKMNDVCKGDKNE